LSRTLTELPGSSNVRSTVLSSSHSMTSFVRFSEIWRIRALAKWWAVGFHDFTFIVEPSGLLPKVATPITCRNDCQCTVRGSSVPGLCCAWTPQAFPLTRASSGFPLSAETVSLGCGASASGTVCHPLVCGIGISAIRLDKGRSAKFRLLSGGVKFSVRSDESAETPSLPWVPVRS
jgi:hypothetical protein